MPWSQNNVRLVQPGLNLDKVNDYMKRFAVPVFVNGRPADAIRDSAADYCLIHPRVVQGIPCVIGSKTRIQCALGLVRTIPTCKINISSPRFENGREFQVTAGIVDGLPYDVILGSNLYIENPALLDIIGTCKDDDRKERAQTETRKNEQTNIRQSPRDRRTETPLPGKAALIAISHESRGDGAIHGRTVNDSHKESSQRSDQSNWRDKQLTETRYNGHETYRRYQRNGPRTK